MQCQHCQKCCGEDPRININLSVGDIFRICQFLKITIDEFFEKYAGIKTFQDPRIGDYKDLGLNIPCKFRKDMKCTVYEARPANCRIFPYWVLTLAPEDKLKQVLKYPCKYDLNKKPIYKKYQDAIAEILLEEVNWYKEERLDTKQIKQIIAENLIKISLNTEKLKQAEKILINN